ncbi:methyl-accepting chemotaxis protein [Caldisalinibacter kiritimatiensis]|uniref:Methyl-accepting chemotaxis protein I (Serine chemoreceptor protein) n=1 Tax=Caldisalinibacter kiritimatiensis TaxID=1304284 RepID=R1CRB8_9FIRM|nr:methyl-accepting chemotaxis protein [Caldisalinibacter kiritimatiensis]EOC99258.1 Methyl-accepting chemotaxis protein I (serine chemoreceptor protein) [Caldisalinibacter kiritimatiensis]
MFKLFNNIKLGFKISGGFAILIIIIIFMSYMGYSGLDNVKINVDQATDASDYAKLALELRRSEKNFMLTQEQQYIDAIDQNIEQMLKNLDVTKSKLSQAEDKQKIDELKKLAEDYKQAANNYAKTTNEQNQLRQTFIENEATMINAIKELQKSQKTELDNLLLQIQDGQVDKQMIDLIQGKLNSYGIASKLLDDINRIGENERNFIINLSIDEEQSKYANDTFTAFKTAENTLEELKTHFREQQDIDRAQQVLNMIQATKVSFNDIVSAEETKDEEKAILIQTARSFLELTNNMEQKQLNDMNSAHATSLTTILIAAIIAVVISIILSFVLSRIITKPILAAVDTAAFIADGDLNEEINEKFKSRGDELGKLSKSFDKMINSLNNTLTKISQSSDTVTTAAEEIATGNQDLSQRTQEQASSLEEFSSTIEEITSSIDASSANAIEAVNLSDKTLSSVNEGEEVVKDLQGAMEEITASSNEIAEIIGKVNDIAFQTNLLALNAAVEAARAGESGRGFAVVAAEVRNLAGRAAESAKEIEKLIKKSIKRIENGNELMEETRKVLDGIVENTRKTSDVVGEIAAALREQSSATTEIDNTIEQLNQVTQQNASLVEEIASSSENMSSEAIELRDLVDQFKLSTQHKNISRRPNTNKISKTIVKNTKQQAAASQEDDDFEFDPDDFEKF